MFWAKKNDKQYIDPVRNLNIKIFDPMAGVLEYWNFLTSRPRGEKQTACFIFSSKIGAVRQLPLLGYYYLEWSITIN